jgi:hypothetical protein
MRVFEQNKGGDEVIIDIRGTIEPNVTVNVISTNSRNSSKSPIASKPPLHRSESANKRVNNLA